MVEHLPCEMKYVDDFFDICVGQMEINEQELLDERSSPPVLGYTAWEQISAMTDDVFSNYVRMIPCIVVSNSVPYPEVGRAPTLIQ